MGKKRNDKTFEIALSGISCAIAAGALALGILSGWLVATGYLIGIIALMLPLSKQFFKGGLLAYLGTVILAVVLGCGCQVLGLGAFCNVFRASPVIERPPNPLQS